MILKDLTIKCQRLSDEIDYLHFAIQNLMAIQKGNEGTIKINPDTGMPLTKFIKFSP